MAGAIIISTLVVLCYCVAWYFFEIWVRGLLVRLLIRRSVGHGLKILIKQLVSLVITMLWSAGLAALITLLTGT